ncbi:Anoctamin [Gracilaria domingensis]|nr:Anoctamin [Gracilaria domingensis]
MRSYGSFASDGAPSSPSSSGDSPAQPYAPPPWSPPLPSPPPVEATASPFSPLPPPRTPSPPAADLASYGEPPASGWEYVLVFPHKSPPLDEHAMLTRHARARVLARLRAGRFAYCQTWLPAQSCVLVQLALPEPELKLAAEQLAIELQLLPQYGGGYMPYARDRSHVFANDARRENGLPYFTAATRLRITVQALAVRDGWGAAIDLPQLRRSGYLSQAYALHAEPDRANLLKTAVYDRLWKPGSVMPIPDLRHYFGARVTIYFAWLVFYARMLTGIALISIPAYFVITRSDSTHYIDWTRLLFGLALCFWGTYWLEHWKRRNFVLNVKWGLTDLEDERENSQVRSDFRGNEQTGFYSRGGFVHLSDMHPATSGSNRAGRIRTRLIRSDLPGVPDHVADVVAMGGTTDPDFVLEAPVTGLVFADLPVHPYRSKTAFKRRLYVSAAVTLFFSLCVAFASFSILFYKADIVFLFHSFGANRIANSVPGIATALLISISDPLWKMVSTILTDWENHRTNQSYENSLIVKHFAFQFVSSFCFMSHCSCCLDLTKDYISLFYIAFVKPFTPSDPCIIGPFSSEPDCMHELQTQLTSLIITKATIQQLLELGIPFIIYQVNRWFKRKVEEHQEERMTEEERQRLLAEGATLRAVEDDPAIAQLNKAPYVSTIADYGELVIQHGYLVMFGLAFPLAAVINFFNNVIESRTDLYKLLDVQQRPDADEAEDIGVWLGVLSFFSVASAMTTAGLLTITTPALQKLLPDFIGDSAEAYPAVSFIIFEHIMLGIRWLVRFLVGDKPASAYRTFARQEFLKARCFNVNWKPYYRANNWENDVELPQDVGLSVEIVPSDHEEMS